MNFTHLVITPFTGRGLYNGYRGDNWLRRRIEIFKSTSIKSLLNQTNRNFIHWICWRPEEKDNSIVEQLREYMEGLDYKFIFDFNGIPLWDDKYEDDKLQERLKAILPQMEKAVGDVDYVYATFLDSDDMYSEEVIDSIQKENPKENQALIYYKGYLYDLKKRKLAEWKMPQGAPCYTIIHSKKKFLDPKKHYNYIKKIINHGYISDKLKSKEIPGREYCQTVHGDNISTQWLYPFMKEITGDKKQKILRKFGL